MNDKRLTRKALFKRIGISILILALGWLVLMVYISIQFKKEPLNFSGVALDLSDAGEAGNAVREVIEDSVEELQTKPQAPELEQAETQKNE